MNKPPHSRYYSAVLIGLWFIFFNPDQLPGQLSGPGRPLPLDYYGAAGLKIYDIMISEEQKTRALAEDEHSLLKPARSGLLIDASYSPEHSGTWDTMSDGTKIWRAAFHITGASMLNIVFSPYKLNKGVRVFLYNRKQQNVLGAFTDLNNKPFNRLGTAQIPGDFLIVEIQVPKYLESLGSIGISGIGCDFSREYKAGRIKDGWFGISGSCNVDIGCVNDTLVQILKNAVVRIVFNGTERCTGTLVNNAMKDGANYVLTAEHCISEEDEANTAVFYFDYESPYCNGPDGNSAKTISGSTIRATGEKLDFTLLELFEPVPFTYQPFYAGWSYLNTPPSSGFTIHHPWGDVKKISDEDNALSAASFGYGYDDNTHWLVSRWERGTTEDGSSGGAFFDQHGLIAGTLSGGWANCTSPVNDYFQMLSHSWDDYPNDTSQLACWLDPLKITNGYLQGYDPYLKYKLTGDTLSNIGDQELVTSLTGSLSWGSYSGHNSLYTTGFAEKYTVTGQKSIPGLFLSIDRYHVSNEQATIWVKVWSGTSQPGSVLYEKTIFMSDLFADTLNFIEFDSVVSVDQVFFVGYELAYNMPLDTFSTFMAANRVTEPLVNTAFIYNGNQWQSLDDFTAGDIHSSYGVFPVVFDSIISQKPGKDFSGRLTAYPNPAGSRMWLEFREITALPLNVTFYNMQGQAVLQRNYGPYQRVIPIELNLSPGIYLIRVNEGQQVHQLKVVIIK